MNERKQNGNCEMNEMKQEMAELRFPNHDLHPAAKLLSAAYSFSPGLEKLGVRVVTDVKVETVDDKGVIAQGVEDQ